MDLKGKGGRLVSLLLHCVGQIEGTKYWYNFEAVTGGIRPLRKVSREQLERGLFCTDYKTIPVGGRQFWGMVTLETAATCELLTPAQVEAVIACPDGHAFYTINNASPSSLAGTDRFSRIICLDLRCEGRTANWGMWWVSPLEDKAVELHMSYATLEGDFYRVCPEHDWIHESPLRQGKWVPLSGETYSVLLSLATAKRLKLITPEQYEHVLTDDEVRPHYRISPVSGSNFVGQSVDLLSITDSRSGLVVSQSEPPSTTLEALTDGEVRPYAQHVNITLASPEAALALLETLAGAYAWAPMIRWTVKGATISTRIDAADVAPQGVTVEGVLAAIKHDAWLFDKAWQFAKRICARNDATR